VPLGSGHGFLGAARLGMTSKRAAVGESIGPAREELDSAKVSAIGVVPSGVPAPLASYRYDAAGLRRSETDGGVTTTYTWDVASSLPVVLQDGTYTYVYGMGLISQTDASGSQSYFLGNGLGSTEALTDELRVLPPNGSPLPRHRRARPQQG